VPADRRGQGQATDGVAAANLVIAGAAKQAIGPHGPRRVVRMARPARWQRRPDGPRPTSRRSAALPLPRVGDHPAQASTACRRAALQARGRLARGHPPSPGPALGGRGTRRRLIATDGKVGGPATSGQEANYARREKVIHFFARPIAHPWSVDGHCLISAIRFRDQKRSCTTHVSRVQPPAVSGGCARKHSLRHLETLLCPCAVPVHAAGSACTHAVP
jgi:hypothetical protein